MKKFLLSLIPITTLAFFILIMTSGNYLKKPLNPSEDVVAFINVTIEDIQSNDWERAKNSVVKLEHAWKKIIPRIQFSVERDEIYLISINIARLKGALLSQDKSSALIELNAALENWHELTR